MRPYQRGANVFGFFDVLAIAAQALGHFVVARVAKIASGFFAFGVGCPAPIQADHHQDRQLVAHSRVKFHGVQAERTVAMHHDHLLVGARGLCAHAKRHAHAHHAEGAGIQAMCRRECRHGLTTEIQNFLTIHHQNGIALHEVFDFFAQTQRMDRRFVHRHAAARFAFFLGFARDKFLAPRCVVFSIDAACHRRQHLLQHGLAVADDADIHLAGCAGDFIGIDVDARNRRACGKTWWRGVSNDVVHARADDQYQIGIAECR